MIFRQYVRDIIKKRISVRTYKKTEIEQDKRNVLNDCMEELNTEDYRFVLMDFNFAHGTKLGTYGMIKGAQTYIVGIYNKEHSHNNKMAVDFGYAFEELVLKSTDLGLGTCWMAATFNSSHITKLISLKEEEQIVMVSPVGYEDDRRLSEKLTRKFAKSDSRKPWSEIFFSGDFETPLKEAEVGKYKEVLEMVRLGPSASNIQPWRILKTSGSYDLYAAKSPYSNRKNQKMSITHNDIGIAKAHFNHTANELGLHGQWVIKEQNILSSENLLYVCSWVYN